MQARVHSRSPALWPLHRKHVVLGPISCGEGIALLRTPRLSDADAWVKVRLANRARLEPVFPASEGADWAQEQTRLSWADRYTRLHEATRHGLAYPYVLTLDGTLCGEIGLDAIDDTTATGEVSLWVSSAIRRGQTTAALVALVVLHAFTAEHPLQRVVGPVPIHNKGAALLGRRLGYQRELTLSSYRGGPTGRDDHDIWVLHNTADVRATLRTIIAAAASLPTRSSTTVSS